MNLGRLLCLWNITDYMTYRNHEDESLVSSEECLKKITKCQRKAMVNEVGSNPPFLLWGCRRTSCALLELFVKKMRSFCLLDVIPRAE